MMCLAIFPLRSSAPKTSISDSLGVSAPKALNLERAARAQCGRLIDGDGAACSVYVPCLVHDV